MIRKSTLFGLAALPALLAALPAWAQQGAAAAGPVVDKGDTAWMMTATILVLFMTLPGLALFYGGLVRAKNMLSILMQTTMVACMVMILWVVYGYSVTFGGGTSPYWGGLGKLFLTGVTADSTPPNFHSSAKAPMIRAGVMEAQVLWTATKPHSRMT